MDKQLPVSVWPEWKITEKIGEGSFGKVYKACRSEQGTTFYSAIKVITIPSNPGELSSVRSESPNEQSVKEYFQGLVDECIQEVSTMEYFRGNSHVVSVEDYKVVEYLDDIGWDIYIRMEYLTSFMEYCAGRALSEDDVIRLGIDLCKALEYCQCQNIIHRDIKPENIFVSRFGEFKLGDFGIARELERTMSGLSKKGTYSYMAPEMYKGEAYDSRVDIYSLGIVLYKLRNHNRLPFISLEKQLITYRDKETALARRMAGEKMPVPVNASAAFSHIILKACAYEPGKRYRKPEDMLRDLEKLRLAPVNAEKEWEKSQWELTNSAELERDQRRYAPQKPEDCMERTHVAEDPQIEKAVREEEAQLRKPAKNAVKNYEKQSVNASFSKQKKQQRSGWDQERQISPWTVSLIVVALAACIIIGVYMKLIHDENRKAQNTENVMEVLEANDNSTAQIDEFSTSIQTIKEQANTIVSELPDCKEVGKEGDRLRYYDSNGKLVKALIYPETSEDGVYEEYYYWDERLFFAYVWTGNKKELYYYDKRGKLIRWIDTDETVHDKENDSTEYTKRGEKYWKNALEQLDE